MPRTAKAAVAAASGAVAMAFAKARRESAGISNAEAKAMQQRTRRKRNMTKANYRCVEVEVSFALTRADRAAIVVDVALTRMRSMSPRCRWLLIGW